MAIRKAVENDVPALVGLAARMHEEGRYRKITFDVSKMTQLFFNGVRNPRRFVAIVAEVDGRVVGAAAGQVFEYLFGPECLLQDIGLYVLPEHRKSSIGNRLLSSFLAEGGRLGVREIVMYGTTMQDPDALDNLFIRAGMEKVGGVYKKEIV